MTCLAKIIGGGLPAGCFGGRAEIMDLLAPDGPVYQAGTLSGNPVAMAAGRETLAQLEGDAYERLEKLGARIEDGLNDIIRTAGRPAVVQRIGSMFTLFLGIERASTLAEVESLDREAFRVFFHAMLERGFYLPPSPFEASFLSLAHTEADVDGYLAAARETLT